MSPIVIDKSSAYGDLFEDWAGQRRIHSSVLRKGYPVMFLGDSQGSQNTIWLEFCTFRGERPKTHLAGQLGISLVRTLDAGVRD